MEEIRRVPKDWHSRPEECVWWGWTAECSGHRDERPPPERGPKLSSRTRPCSFSWPLRGCGWEFHPKLCGRAPGANLWCCADLTTFSWWCTTDWNFFYTASVIFVVNQTLDSRRLASSLFVASVFSSKWWRWVLWRCEISTSKSILDWRAEISLFSSVIW